MAMCEWNRMPTVIGAVGRQRACDRSSLLMMRQVLTLVVLVASEISALGSCSRGDALRGRSPSYWAAALASLDAPVRDSAAKVLVLAASESPSQLHALLAAISSANPGDLELQLPGAAVAAGVSNHQVASALIGLLRDEHAGVRSGAGFALGRLDDHSTALTVALLGALGDSVADVRARAAEALGRVGSRSAAVANALARTTRDSSAAVRLEAVRALALLDADVVLGGVPELVASLGDTSESVRLAATYAIGRLGPVAASAVPALRGALRDEHFGVRSAAVLALGRIGPAARSAIPDLRRMLQDRDSTVRDWAANALKSIGAGPP